MLVKPCDLSGPPWRIDFSAAPTAHLERSVPRHVVNGSLPQRRLRKAPGSFTIAGYPSFSQSFPACRPQHHFSLAMGGSESELAAAFAACSQDESRHGNSRTGCLPPPALRLGLRTAVLRLGFPVPACSGNCFLPGGVSGSLSVRTKGGFRFDLKGGCLGCTAVRRRSAVPGPHGAAVRRSDVEGGRPPGSGCQHRWSSKGAQVAALPVA
jgi:hypothetical protein